MVAIAEKGQRGTEEKVKNLFRIGVYDPLPKGPFEELKREFGCQVDYLFELDKAQKKKPLFGDYDAVVIRSATKIGKDNLADPGRLKTIIRAGVGIDNVDVKAATERGIMVAITPESNTIAAAELTILHISNAARKFSQASHELKEGLWEKVSGFELKGKTLGIIGLGRIGKEVAKRAKLGLEMKVIAHDPFVSEEHAQKLGIELLSFGDLLRGADVITVHVPLEESTRHLIGKKEFEKVKNGVIIINAARGGIIDEKALVKAVQEGKVGAAGLDVFENEPEIDPDLLACRNITCTPHIGASTEEAGLKNAEQVAVLIRQIMQGEIVKGVNMPDISSEEIKRLEPYMELVSSLTSLARDLVSTPIKGISVDYQGEIAELNSKPLKAAVIEGFLKGVSEEPVNLINYEEVAKRRGLVVRESKDTRQNAYTNLIRIKLEHIKGEIQISGIVDHNGASVVEINGYQVDFPLHREKNLLLIQNKDKPGMVGKVSTKLGDLGINISRMNVADKNGRALMVLLLGRPLDRKLLKELQAIPGILRAQFVTLR